MTYPDRGTTGLRNWEGDPTQFLERSLCYFNGSKGTRYRQVNKMYTYIAYS